MLLDMNVKAQEKNKFKYQWHDLNLCFRFSIEHKVGSEIVLQQSPCLHTLSCRVLPLFLTRPEVCPSQKAGIIGTVITRIGRAVDSKPKLTPPIIFV